MLKGLHSSTILRVWCGAVYTQWALHKWRVDTPNDITPSNNLGVDSRVGGPQEALAHDIGGTLTEGLLGAGI